MKVAVWDTYVVKKDKTVMNFDILVPEDMKDENIVFEYGKIYLESKSITNHPLTASHCSLCHIETATDEMIASIKQKGYYIIEIRNC